MILIKLSSPDDRVLGFAASVGDRDLLTVETSRGAKQTIGTAKYEVTGRGGKDRELGIARAHPALAPDAPHALRGADPGADHSDRWMMGPRIGRGDASGTA